MGKNVKTHFPDQTDIQLPAGFIARGASLDDVGTAMKLFNRWSNTFIGRDEFSGTENIREEWQTPGVDPAQDICLVFAPNGELAGYAEAWTTAKPPVHPEIWGRIDPRYEGLGIGTWLMHWAEERAIQALPRVPDELRFAPRTGIYRQAMGSKRLFEDMGYRHIRSSYHMLIELDAPVPEPKFPKGITIRTYQPESDREAVFRARTDAFRDHFGFIEHPLEEGLKRFQHVWEKGNVDPTLMFLAIEESSGEIAGVNLCRPVAVYDKERGWVGSLGVRRPWRKQGLGLALLRLAFNEFYRRGKRKVGLGVDAENLTGALRLYESAGMHIDQAYDHYEKELRPGKEISVQFLS